MNLQKSLFWLLHWLLVLISIVTVVSGIVQIFAPGFILDLLSAEITPATKQCFGTIGMFMVLFGGLLLHVLLTQQMNTPVFLWAGLQKVGAFLGMGIGVFHQIFGPKSLVVAAFDLLSGILIFLYMKMTSTQEIAP